MDEHDPHKASATWICQDEYHRTQVMANDCNEADFPVVIEFWRDVFDTPTINEIYKHEATPEGTITRKARVSVLGQLEYEEEYLNGQRHGSWYMWHSNGTIYDVQSYAQGLPQGTSLTFSPTGKILCKCLYQEGKLVSAWDREADGKWEKVVNHGDGGILSYGENGEANGGEKYFKGEYCGGSN